MKDSCYIYGAGNFGNRLIDIINCYYDDEVVIEGLIDSNKTGSIRGFELKKLESIKDIDSRVIIAIASFKTALAIYKTLSHRGFRNIWWFYKENIVKGTSLFREQCVDCRTWDGGAILQVEMHIMDACNLNCRGCTHFSPIFDRSIPDFSSRINDVKRLAQKISYIHEFYILGGEPFLNPEIDQYAAAIREILPRTNIYIVTNGLLIPRISDNVFDLIRESNVRISISEYKPVHQLIDKIKDKLKRNGVEYSIRPLDDKMMFNRPLTLSENSIHQKLCISYPCVTIWNGYISRCPTLMYISKFNEYFDVSLPNDGIISLNDEISGWDLIDILEKDVPLCAHCIKDEITWGVCDKYPQIEDFAALD